MQDEEIAVRLAAALLVPVVGQAKSPDDPHLQHCVQAAVALYQAMLAEVRRVRPN